MSPNVIACVGHGLLACGHDLSVMHAPVSFFSASIFAALIRCTQ